MLQTNRIPAIFQNRDENPPTYRHTPTFVKHSKRFYPSHPPPPHTSTSSTQPPSPQHTITPTRLTALRSLHGGKPPPARLLPAGQYTAPPSAGAQSPRPQRPGSHAPTPHHPIITTSAPSANQYPQLAKPNPTSSNHHLHPRPEGAPEHSPGCSVAQPRGARTQPRVSEAQPRDAKTQPASSPLQIHKSIMPLCI